MKLHVENESIGATYIAMAFAALSLMSLSVHADQLFVSDKLVISVYTEANQDSDKLTTIDSGDAVEALEKAEGYTHIRLADGREGWVKSSYLNAQTPAIVRLKDLEKERAAGSNAVPPHVTEELRQLQEQNATLHNEVSALKQAAATAHVTSSPEPKESPRKESPTVVRTDSMSSLQAVEWSVAVGLATGLIGFAFGYRSLANRIQRKYGKLKIY